MSSQIRNPKSEIIVVGASLGGVEALKLILPALPAEFALAVVIVQHRSTDYQELLVPDIQRHCLLPVREPDDKEPILPGHVYVAPADYHLLVEIGHPNSDIRNPKSTLGRFALTTEARVNNARPSVDVLFQSAADAFSPDIVAVVLTGANADGAQGALAVQSRGGKVLVQDPATAEAGAMPTAALSAIRPDHVLTPEGIGEWLAGLHRMENQK